MRKGNGETMRRLRRYYAAEGTIPNYSPRNRHIITTAVTLSVIALAALLGRSPPKKRQIEFKENKLEVPAVTVVGYDRQNFSSLQLAEMDGDNSATFYPATAVKKWDGASYTERSRQTNDLYATSSLRDVVLSLSFPQEPQRVLVAGKDVNALVQGFGGKYRVTIPLKETAVLTQTTPSAPGVAPTTTVDSAGLEVLIYYRSTDTDLVNREKIKEHKEDAERYLVTLFEHGTR